MPSSLLGYTTISVGHSWARASASTVRVVSSVSDAGVCISGSAAIAWCPFRSTVRSSIIAPRLHRADVSWPEPGEGGYHNMLQWRLCHEKTEGATC